MSKPRVKLEIGSEGEHWGDIVLELEHEQTPQTTENFLKYVDDGYYDGTIFHRVIGHFMIQGGGYDQSGQYKSAGLRDSIANEAEQGIKNEPHTIAMARTSDPHSATSQFFINVGRNDFLNHPGQDGWGYCAFGTVASGEDVIERLKAVPVEPDPMSGENSKPKTPPCIIKATRVEA